MRKCCLFPVRELLERRPVHPTQQLSMYRRLERGMLSDAHMQSIVLLPWLMCARNIFLSAFANNSFVYAFVSFPVATGTGPQHCKCNSGWQGSTCSEAICEVCDLNHGACTAPETCECKDPSKWKGTACDLPICSVCTNGNCTAPATCTCQEGSKISFVLSLFLGVRPIPCLLLDFPAMKAPLVMRSCRRSTVFLGNMFTIQQRVLLGCSC